MLFSTPPEWSIFSRPSLHEITAQHPLVRATDPQNRNNQSKTTLGNQYPEIDCRIQSLTRVLNPTLKSVTETAIETGIEIGYR